jgi:hypothetical protein
VSGCFGHDLDGGDEQNTNSHTRPGVVQPPPSLRNFCIRQGQNGPGVLMRRCPRVPGCLWPLSTSPVGATLHIICCRASPNAPASRIREDSGARFLAQEQVGRCRGLWHYEPTRPRTVPNSKRTRAATLKGGG